MSTRAEEGPLALGECGLCGGPGALVITIESGCCTQLCARCVREAARVHACAAAGSWAEMRRQRLARRAKEREYLAESTPPGAGR